MKLTKATILLGILGVVSLASQSWAYCEEHNKTVKPAAKAADGAKVTPCSGHGASATATAEAGSKPCCGKKQGCSSAKTWLALEGSSKALLSSLPTMRYRVGEETLDCPAEAEKMAMKADKPVQYVVGEKSFATKPEATVALASMLDETAKELQVVHMTVAGKEIGCPHAASILAKDANTTVKYVVAGAEFADQQKADSVAKLVAEAAGSVKVSYKVGDDSFCCDKMAGVKVKETGKKMTYVVAGEETCCEQTAKLLLAQAKIKAMIDAAANGKA